MQNPVCSKLDNKKDIEDAHSTFSENLKKSHPEEGKMDIAHPGGSEPVDAYYSSKENIWWHLGERPDAPVPRYWNCFGIGEPKWEKNNEITVEINPPMKEATEKVGGAFVKCDDGKTYICHNGRLGGNPPKGFKDELEKLNWKKCGRYFLISDIEDEKLGENLAKYIKLVRDFKEAHKK